MASIYYPTVTQDMSDQNINEFDVWQYETPVEDMIEGVTRRRFFDF